MRRRRGRDVSITALTNFLFFLWSQVTIVGQGSGACGHIHCYTSLLADNCSSNNLLITRFSKWDQYTTSITPVLKTVLSDGRY